MRKAVSVEACFGRPRHLRHPAKGLSLETQKAAVRNRRFALVQESPLRRTDPRVKLALSLGLSLAVMLAMGQLLVVIGLYIAFLAWARLLPTAGRLLWRLRWVLLIVSSQ
jgi:hypothetical protein